jgi:phosphate transport system permease protein
MASQSAVPPSPTPGLAPAASEAQGSNSNLAAGAMAGVGDKIFYWGTAAFAGAVLLLCVLIAINLYRAAVPSISEYGAGFLTSSTWDPEADKYGAWPFIFGTVVSSLLALAIAVPIAIGTAIFLTELAPQWMRTPIGFMVELLAAVPSVVYGLWGIFVMLPALRPVQEFLKARFGYLPFFQGEAQGYSMMAGALILAIMILPFITSVSREVIKAVPRAQREAAFGLGATHWEAIKGPILRYARSGIMGAIVLGLARAVGETLAITMVIGNTNRASVSLLDPGATLASALANQFAEAGGKQLPALMYLALTLFGVTIIINAFARLLIVNMARGMAGVVRD